MDESSWNILGYARRVSVSIHILHQGGILCKRMKESVLECTIPSICLSVSLSVLLSVVTHTTGVYQWLAASRTHTHNALHQCNTRPR